MYSRFAIGFVLAAIAMPTTNLLADTIVSAETPDDLVNIARGYGSARLQTDDDGDPMIIGMIDGVRYGIFFYGCDNGNDCASIQFASFWDTTKVSLNDINEWNRSKRFGKAYLNNSGSVVLEMSVNTKYGVTANNFEDTVDWWRIAMKGFSEEILDPHR